MVLEFDSFPPSTTMPINWVVSMNHKNSSLPIFYMISFAAGEVAYIDDLDILCGVLKCFLDVIVLA